MKALEEMLGERSLQVDEDGGMATLEQVVSIDDLAVSVETFQGMRIH